jgi:hypothetical protein
MSSGKNQEHAASTAPCTSSKSPDFFLSLGDHQQQNPVLADFFVWMKERMLICLSVVNWFLSEFSALNLTAFLSSVDFAHPSVHEKVIDLLGFITSSSAFPLVLRPKIILAIPELARLAH